MAGDPMRTRVLMREAAVALLTMLYFSPAPGAEDMQPLTPQDERMLLRTLDFRAEDVSAIKGWRSARRRKALADVYGTIAETAMGDCTALHVLAEGDIEGDTVTWIAEDSPQITQVIWLEPDRAGRSCTEMLDQPTIILLRSPIEENTLRRIRREGLELALQAGRQLKNEISAEEIRTGRIAELTVNWLGGGVYGGAYEMRWEIAQCRSLSVLFRTYNDRGFEVSGAFRILCTPDATP
jgi:hypothetical protein